MLDAIGQRILPSAAPTPGWWALAALAAGVLAVIVPALWRATRLAVTVVHELGHGIVGILVGRRFTGFVIRGDMSGHAVTVGPARGAGRVASTWAGYPAPGLLGAALVALAFTGWARPALSAALAVLLLSLLLVRSAHTLAVVLVSVAVLGALWWWGPPLLVSGVALAVGVLLLLGAWRHLGTVIQRGGRRDDPGQIAQLTGLPVWAVSGSQALVLALATWGAVAVLSTRL